MGSRVRITVSELSWHRFRRVSRKKLRAVVEGKAGTTIVIVRIFIA